VEHFYFDIPGWFGFHDVYDRAIALLGKDGAHFVEVGSWEGRSAAYMGVNILNSGKKIRFDCVDTWKGSREHIDRGELDALWSKFRGNMSRFDYTGLDIRAIRKPSLLAAKQYADQSLDFVFLDASHDAEDVYDDITAWMPKLKPSGVLAGDDVAWMGVREGLIRAGVGVEGNPVVPSGGTYLSWIFPLDGNTEPWVTKDPEESDKSYVDGQLLSSVEVLRDSMGIEGDFYGQ